MMYVYTFMYCKPDEMISILAVEISMCQVPTKGNHRLDVGMLSEMSGLGMISMCIYVCIYVLIGKYGCTY